MELQVPPKNQEYVSAILREQCTVRGPLISVKRYMDANNNIDWLQTESDLGDTAAAVIAGYRSALHEMGSCAVEICSTLGTPLQQNLRNLELQILPASDCEQLELLEAQVRQHLQEFGITTSQQLRQSAENARELLVLMANTAESVGERDRRCAYRINEVTTRLEVIATFEDVSQMRDSIIRSTSQLKESINKMMADSLAAVDLLRKEVGKYKDQLREAEYIASTDALTGLHSRSFVEEQIRHRIDHDLPTSIVVLDIDGFKHVNDKNGHMIGDELLRQFARNLRSVCRETDVIGRWGGDEFIILLDQDGPPAKAHVERLSTWLSRDYSIAGKCGALVFRVTASIGMAEHTPGETMLDLFDRADAYMYEFKTTQRRANGTTGRK